VPPSDTVVYILFTLVLCFVFVEVEPEDEKGAIVDGKPVADQNSTVKVDVGGSVAAAVFRKPTTDQSAVTEVQMASNAAAAFHRKPSTDQQPETVETGSGIIYFLWPVCVCVVRP